MNIDKLYIMHLFMYGCLSIPDLQGYLNTYVSAINTQIDSAFLNDFANFEEV